MSKVESLAAAALRLPRNQRLILAREILASLEPLPNAENDHTWDAEIRRRIEAYDAHPGGAIDATEALANLAEELRK